MSLNEIYQVWCFKKKILINMKKTFLILALVAMVMCCISGCSKKCKCKAKVNGEVLVEKTIDLDDGESCSDYNTTVNVAGVSASLKCTMTF